MSDKKQKKGKKQQAAGPAKPAVSVAAHPRARVSIRRIRARTAIGAFALVLLLSLNAAVPGQEAVVRALVAGLVGNVLGWFCALGFWRHIVLAELRLVEEKRAERRRAAVEAAASA
jgi:hypothetical protein